MARTRGRREKSLKRRVGTRAPRKTLLVFCEGARTEPEYLEALKRQPAVRDISAVDIRIDHRAGGSVPLTLVRMAVDARRVALEEEGEIDEFWCVFDVEWPRNHPHLGKALALAAQNEIHVALSNPCFELCLALHFRDQNGWLTTAEACRLRREHDKSTDKGLDPGLYMPRRDAAKRHAAALDERHDKNDKVSPRDNPSSGMHLLLASVEAPLPVDP